MLIFNIIFMMYIGFCFLFFKFLIFRGPLVNYQFYYCYMLPSLNKVLLTYLLTYVRSHFKPTETFQYTYYSPCHPPGVSKGFIKGKALRLLRTNSSKTTFEENIRNFIVRLRMRGYPRHLVDHILSE